jgi:hypothetical protein
VLSNDRRLLGNYEEQVIITGVKKSREHCLILLEKVLSTRRSRCGISQTDAKASVFHLTSQQWCCQPIRCYAGSPLILPTQATGLSQSHNPSPSAWKLSWAENQSSEAASIASIKILCCGDIARYQGDFEVLSIMFSPYSAEMGIMGHLIANPTSVIFAKDCCSISYFSNMRPCCCK